MIQTIVESKEQVAASRWTDSELDELELAMTLAKARGDMATFRWHLRRWQWVVRTDLQAGLAA